MNYLRTCEIILRRTLYRDHSLIKEKTNDSLIFSLRTTVIFYKIFNIPSITEFLFIEFNGVMLRFDNVGDHYVTFYRRDDKCANDEKDKFCATCAWNYNGYSNYLKWCLDKNVCEGRKQLYLRNNAEDIISVSSLLDRQNEEVYVTNDCPEVNVTAVHPLFGPHTGGTVVTITVRNHWILVEYQMVLVMVAGMVCTNPMTSGLETITCTTSPWLNITGGPPALGPILVKYSSDKGGLTIESSQKFQYDVRPVCGSPRPALDAKQRLRALESGDITVPVRGAHFVKPCVTSSARFFVVLPNGTMQFASSDCDKPVNDTYIVCRSPRVDSHVWRDADSSVEGLLLNFGLNVMNFIGNQSLLVLGPPHGFHVLFDPVLVDFNIINSTGSVEFNGRYLNHVQADVILIRIPKLSAKSCKSVLDCLVVAACFKDVVFSQQRMICKPNVTIASAATASRNILVTIGDRLSYTVPNRSSPPGHSDLTGPVKSFILFDWWRTIISLSMSLLIVFALVCCLKTKNQYDLTETFRYPPLDFSRS
uniref:IPT/TIG domain-containing protein n=1 Tax=Schizaphis graminum TaxID=13262 RepID=A0A2S2NAI5_SCHGA